MIPLPGLLLPLVLLAGACAEAPVPDDASPTVGPDTTAAHAPLPYRLAAPDAAFELAPPLAEISGLVWLPSGRLGAVEDENGTLYELDPATGAVVRATPFAGAGDFEGLAFDGEVVWALESNGSLYRLAEGEAVRPVASGVAATCDAEGLAWDAGAARLLVACKERPGVDDPHVRSVHAFDPATSRLDPAPAFLLDRRALDRPGAPFKPSALARHPASGLWYVASSTTRTVVAVDAQGRVHGEGGLPQALAPQPEGLAFAPDGTLYVASEGRPGRLLRFAPSADTAP